MLAQYCIVRRLFIEQTTAAASEGKRGGGDASLDVEQLALAFTPDPQDQQQFPELHNVRPPPVCIPSLLLLLQS